MAADQHFLDEGIITDRVAIIDPSKVGLGVTVLVFAKIDGRTGAKLQDFIEAVREMPEIIECHALMGDVDVLLKILVPDIAGYEQLMWNKLDKMPGLVGMRSSISVTRFVDTTRLPLRPHRPRPITDAGRRPKVRG